MVQKPKNRPQQNQLLIIGGIVAVVVIVVAGVIFFQMNQSSQTINYDDIQQTRLDDGGYLLGDPDAPVTIVAFEDFLCPHCQTYQSTVKQFIEDHVKTGEANFEFRMLISIDPTLSTFAFQLVECSDELKPGSFWTAHDTMFDITSSQRFSEQSARQFAEEMGLSYGALLECTEDADQWRADALVAQDQEWVTGTPAIGWRGEDDVLRKAPLTGRPSNAELTALVASQQ